MQVHRSGFLKLLEVQVLFSVCWLLANGLQLATGLPSGDRLFRNSTLKISGEGQLLVKNGPRQRWLGVERVTGEENSVVHFGIILQNGKVSARELERFLRAFLFSWTLARHQHRAGGQSAALLDFVLHVSVCADRQYRPPDRITKLLKQTFEPVYGHRLTVHETKNCRAIYEGAGKDHQRDVRHQYDSVASKKGSLGAAEGEKNADFEHAAGSIIFLHHDLGDMQRESGVVPVHILDTANTDFLVLFKQFKHERLRKATASAHPNLSEAEAVKPALTRHRSVLLSSKPVLPSTGVAPEADDSFASLQQRHIHTLSSPCHSCRKLWQREFLLYNHTLVKTIQSPVRTCMEDPEGRGISLLSQASIDRLTILPQLCWHWTGLIDIAVFVNSHTHAAKARQIAATSPCWNRLRLHIVNQHSPRDSYPINFLRNVVLERATTDLVFFLDIDFLPALGLHDQLMHFLQGQTGKWLEQQALVVPAFQLDGKRLPRVRIPATKAEVVRMIDASQMIGFHSKTFPPAHAPTNVTRWLTATEPYAVKWRLHYEPYMAGHRNAFPPYDPFIPSRMGNKASHSMHMEALGRRLLVHHDAFSVHIDHPPAVKQRRMIACVRRIWCDFLKYIKSITT